MTDLVQRVRSRLVAEGGGLPLDDLVRDASGAVLDDSVLAVLHREVTAELSGAGPLEELLALPGVTDVLVNGPGAVWFDRGRGLERATVRFPDDAAVRRLAQRLAARAGRRLDDACPFVDGCLPDGTRLHAVLPPLTEATTLSLRVLRRKRYDLDALVRLDTVPGVLAAVLCAVVAARLTLLLSGGTGAGKTTLLGALLALVPPGERLLLIEDDPELVVDHPHVVRLLARPANIEGAGEVAPRALVRQALRMRPDRLVVGEFRGPETLDLLVALNTGHEGGAATLHANSARDVPARLTALALLAGQPPGVVARLAASAVHLVVHLRRDRDHHRTISEIALLQQAPGGLEVVEVWSRPAGVGPGAAWLARMLAERDVPVPALLAGRRECPR